MSFQILAGHLAADPEQRVTPQGHKATKLRLPVRYKRGQNEDTIWWSVTVWGDNPILPHLKKGSAIIVSGEMAPPRIYKDREGNDRVGLELNADSIRFSPFRRPDSPSDQSPTQHQEPAFASTPTSGQSPTPPQNDNDDLPF